MTFLATLRAVSAVCLLAAGAQAQQAQPGSTLTPASAAPQAQTQPNLRADSKPHTNLDASTDSGPLPETLGMDATPLMDMGLDYSLAETSEQPAVLKRIVTRKGSVEVVEVQTRPVMPRPVTNPPEPQSRIIADIPQPRSHLKPPPPDPLAGISQ